MALSLRLRAGAVLRPWAVGWACLRAAVAVARHPSPPARALSVTARRSTEGGDGLRAAPGSQKRIRIYTRTGDKGTSSLFTGERASKTSDVFEALGTVDELSSSLGMAAEHCKAAGNGLDARIVEIQCRLQDIGSCVATPRTSASARRIEQTPFLHEHAAGLEAWMDELDEGLPPLRVFILPSGGLASTSLHYARAVARRAERRVVPLLDAKEVDASVAQYLNRLSDFLFVGARFAAHYEQQEDAIYRPFARPG